ncbi:MAG: AAA family ATPase [Sedimentibacter sp.]
MGKVVLVGSQKSDIGKTIICIKSGMMLAKEGKKVLLVDLSSGKKKMSEYLNVNEDIIYDIKDVLDTTCSLDQAIIEINESLSLLPCPRIAGKLNEIKMEEFSKLFSNTIKDYDIIIADVDKVSNSYIDFKLTNVIVSVNNNDFSCIKEINSDKNIARKYNVESIFAVLNKYNKKKAKNGAMMNTRDIQKMTELNMDLIIEENLKYINADYDFLFKGEDNSFNKVIESLTSKI